MTERVTVSLPDDVAARLHRERNVSAYVTDALRERMSREETARLLAEHGFVLTEEGRARARSALDAARARMTPERWEQLRRVGR